MTQLLEALSIPFRRIPAAAPSVLQPRRQELLFRHCVLGAETAVLAGSFLLAYEMRNRFAAYGALLPLETYAWVFVCIVGVWLTLSRMSGLDASRTYRWLDRAIWTTLKVHVIGALMVLSALYMMKAYDVSRLFMQTFLVVSGVALVAERVAIYCVLASLARRPAAHVRRVLVIGATPAAARLQQLCQAHPHWGAEVTGFVSTSSRHIASLDIIKPRFLGTMDDVPELLDKMVFDEVVVSDGVNDTVKMRAVAEECLQRGLTFHTLLPMPSAPKARYHAEALDDGLYLMSVERTPQSLLPLILKRAIDVIGGMVGLAACGILYVILAPLIRWESDGPVLFSQERVGRNGRLFTLYKFRTMCSDAEVRKATLTAGNDMNGHLFKMRCDPRVTRIGRFLRRTYLDEFPQFWNVLRGDMSLVGTRPPVVDEAASYAPHHRRRLSIRPGLTGLWQVQGNGRVTDFEEVVRLDCEYIDRWSNWLDVRILLRTCITMARLSGH